MSVPLVTLQSLSQLWRRAGNVSRRSFFRAHDAVLTSFGEATKPNQLLARLIPPGIHFSPTDADASAVELFLRHRFDLLGSGWVRVFHGMDCLGFERIRFDPPERRATPEALVHHLPKHGRSAVRRIRALISPEYIPIDWQVDFRSGYRWSERTWYRDIAYGSVPGADIKVPWELSRLQHFPELAVAYLVGKDRRYRQEFRNQALDWIASNPPRFGANWASTMDVGIRIANLLIAYDLFRSAGDEFDDEFSEVVVATAYDHARHISQNLEWSERRRSNHYLGDVCGLLVTAAYLPPDGQTDSWLAFAVQELAAETDRQFLSDGGHFEASTSYHRLCAEMVVVCGVLCEAIPASRIESLFASTGMMRYGPKLRPSTPGILQNRYRQTEKLFPDEFYARILNAARFTMEMTKPDGTVVQIGDNDSGRFLRIGGWVLDGTIASARTNYQNLALFHDLPDHSPYFAQPSLNHQQWLAWASALLGMPELLDQGHAHNWQITRALADGLVRGKRWMSVAPFARKQEPHGAAATMQVPGRMRGVTHRVTATHPIDAGDLLDGVSIAAFPEFGAYVVRSNRLHLVIRCGSSMRDGAGTHAHEDHLAAELTIDGTTITADPGTYVYTASRALRNGYRSAAVHASPSVVGPVAKRDPAPFSPPLTRESRCQAFGIEGFRGTMTTEGGVVTREIVLRAGAIDIIDEYELKPAWSPASRNPLAPATSISFSPAYGVRTR